MKTPTPPRPDAADRGDHEVDPDAPPSEEELRAAAELREALGDATRDHEGAALARAVVLAHSPRAIDPDVNATLVERALARADKGAGAGARVVSLAPRREQRLASAWATAVGVVALAASVLIFQQQRSAPMASLEPPMVHVHSAQALFHEPFASRGGTSSRIDRIASARAADLRENMFARWDVR